ncbi:MAG: hypothetical protein RM021_006435 [Nostoc sp. EkiNYC01]|nr:hypothetical protein [Nostoc sp. EkiNYC01]
MTICLWLYGSVSFQRRKPAQEWTVGSCGGALFAFLLLTNSSLFF